MPKAIRTVILHDTPATEPTSTPVYTHAPAPARKTLVIAAELVDLALALQYDPIPVIEPTKDGILTFIRWMRANV